MTQSVIPSIINDIESTILERFAHLGAPGLAVGVVIDGNLAWSKGFGRARKDNDNPPNERTISRVASITKTFTATAIVQLRDEGLLNLDDPIVLHIPEFSAVRTRTGRVEDVTIRRLLTHRSGLSTETPLPTWAEPCFPSMKAILDALPDTEIVIHPESAWKYSNLGYSLLGEVVSRLSSRPYVDYVHQEILQPLGLKSSTYELTDKIRCRFFTGHDAAQIGKQPTETVYAHLNGMSAAGQLHSCVEDLALWAAFQFQEDGGERKGTQILRGASLQEMHRPQFLDQDWSNGQCLAWRAARVGNQVFHEHGGGVHGFSSSVRFNLQHRTAVVVLANVWPPQPALRSLLQELIQSVTESVSASNPQTTPTREQAPPVRLAPYVGSYLAYPGSYVQIVYSAQSLLLQHPPSGLMALHAPGSLEPTVDRKELIVRGGRGSGEIARFDFNEDGSATAFTLGGFRYVRQPD